MKLDTLKIEIIDLHYSFGIVFYVEDINQKTQLEKVFMPFLGNNKCKFLPSDETTLHVFYLKPDLRNNALEKLQTVLDNLGLDCCLPEFTPEKPLKQTV